MSSPTQFDGIAETYFGKYSEGNNEMDTLWDLAVTYEDTHSGKAVDGLAKSMRHLANSLRMSLFGYDNVALAARTVASGLRKLESSAAEADGLAGLVSDLRKVEESEPTPGFDTPQQGDSAYGAYSAVKAEFNRIQAAEEVLLNEFAGELHEAERGRKSNLDNAELDRFLGRMVQTLPPASETYKKLAAAKALLIDEVDGSLDTLDGQLAELAEQGVSPEDIEAIAGHPRAGEVADFHPDLAVAVARDEVDFPSDKDKDRTASAIENGESPADAGLPPLYFPPDYRETAAELDEVQRVLESLEEGGYPRSDFFVDGGMITAETRAGQIENLKRGAAGLEAELDTTPDRDGEGLDAVRSTTITGDYFGDDWWKGQRLGEIYEENYVEPDGRGFFDEKEPKSELSGQALAEISEGIEGSVDSSTKFFEEIGVEHAAALPSVVVERTKSDDVAASTIDNFSVGLGEATRSGGLPEGFSGKKLIEQGDRNTAALFHAGDFEIDFESDALVAVLEQSPGERTGKAAFGGKYYWRGFDWDGRDGLAEHFGVDDRDSVFEKGAENPALGVEVAQRLIDNGNADVLIHRVPNQPQTDYAERPPPITGFLATVGHDPGVAGGLLAEAVDRNELQVPAAAGIDAIMAQHSTIIYDATYLGDHGIDSDGSGRLSQEHAQVLFGVGAEEWSRLSGLVSDQGFGGFLAAGNEALALENAIVDGDGVVDFSDPKRSFERFGYVSGALEGQWFETRERVAQELDDDADEKNMYANVGLGAAIGLSTVAAPITVGVAAGVGGAGLGVLAPEFWKSDEVAKLNEVERGDLNSRQVEQQAQARLAYLRVTGEPIEVETKGDSPETVTVSVETREVVEPGTGAVVEEFRFVFVDENGDSWDPQTAKDPLDWDTVDPGYGGEGVASDWDSEIGAARAQGYGEVGQSGEVVDGESRSSSSGDGVGTVEVDAVSEYLGVMS